MTQNDHIVLSHPTNPTIGQQLAEWLDFNSTAIVEACIDALTDANLHREAAALQRVFSSEVNPMPPMITVRIHRENEEDGVLVQLMTIPRIGETISLPDADGQERDLQVTGVNHWVTPVEGHLAQAEIIVFSSAL
jgi:hypothetical protein